MLTGLSPLQQRIQSLWESSHPLPLGMSETGTPTTKGHSSPLSPGKADKPAIPRLVGVENKAPSGWEGREYILEINGFKGHPVMGSKLYSMGAPIMG